jgi:hypothetical protein
MIDLSDGRKVGILKWSTRGRGVCRTTSRIYEVEKGAKGAQVEEGIVWTQIGTESMKYEN